LFKGNYNGKNSSLLFCGTTTAEMFLIRAEAKIRSNLLPEAAEDVNLLRSKRFSDQDFVPVTFENKEQGLDFIKRERRRELIFRGQKWPDTRRYASLGEYLDSMQRTAEGKSYLMTSEQILNYAYRIPDVVIDNGNLVQND